MIVVILIWRQRGGSGLFFRQLNEDNEADAAGRGDKPVAGILENVDVGLCEGNLEYDGGEGTFCGAGAEGECGVGLLLHGGRLASGWQNVVGASVQVNLVVFVETEELDQEHEAVHARAQGYYRVVNGGMHTLELEDASKWVVVMSINYVSTW